MMRNLILCFLLTATTLSAYSFDHNYESWKRVIAQSVDYSVSPATVDYMAIKENRHDFSENLKKMVAVTEKDYKSFSSDQRKAFILNLYAAVSIKAVLDQIKDHKAPVTIKEASRTFNDIFDQDLFKLFGQKRSLNYIEKNLAEEFNSDFKLRVAFACAAKGCPPPGYYTAGNLNQTLNEVIKSFLSWDKNLTYTMSSNTLKVIDYFESREKYIKHTKEYSSLGDFLIRHAPISELLKDKALKSENTLEIEFMKMDWALNIHQTGP